MQYLTDYEIPTYCTLQAGVEESDVKIASSLIDAYVGYSFQVNQVKETVKINRKSKGKLNNYPIIEIISAKEVYRSPLGKSTREIDIDDIDLDIEMDGYFTYYSKVNPFAMFTTDTCNIALHEKQHTLEIEYKYGYEEIPEDIKNVCAMLSQNIRQMNSFAGFKKLNTLDYTVEMSNPSFFTQDMKIILDKYRLV